MLKPLNDYVVVEIAKPEERTESGIILPANTKGEKNQRGVVVAIGPGRFNQDGKRLPMSVSNGANVLLNWGGTEVEVKQTKFRVLREDDIIAVIE